MDRYREYDFVIDFIFYWKIYSYDKNVINEWSKNINNILFTIVTYHDL